MKLTKSIKQKVETYLTKCEGGHSFSWGTDYCTSFDKNGKAIDDYMIDIDEEGIWYTPVSCWRVTLPIE